MIESQRRDHGLFQKEIDRLTKNLSKSAQVPKGIGLWSEAMVLAWLRSNQRKKAAAHQ